MAERQIADELGYIPQEAAVADEHIYTKNGIDQSHDIVTRLRTVVAVPNGVDIWTMTALDAADEIVRLRAEVERLSESLSNAMRLLSQKAHRDENRLDTAEPPN